MKPTSSYNAIPDTSSFTTISVQYREVTADCISIWLITIGKIALNDFKIRMFKHREGNKRKKIFRSEICSPFIIFCCIPAGRCSISFHVGSIGLLFVTETSFWSLRSPDSKHFGPSTQQKYYTWQHRAVHRFIIVILSRNCSTRASYEALFRF